MVRILIVSLLLVGMYSCKSESMSAKDAHERLVSGEFDAYSHFSSVPCEELVEDSLGNHYQDDSLFTGVCYTTYPNTGAKLEIRQIFEGRLHGHRFLLAQTGDTISMNLYRHGKLLRESIGRNEVCNCDSLEIVEQEGKEYRYYFDEPYTGRCQKFYPESDSTQLYIESNFTNGLLSGKTTVYDREGNVILEEKYLDGEKLN